MSMVCTGSAASRCFQAGAKYGNAEFIQVHPTADSRRRQAAADERKGPRRRGPRVGAAQAARSARSARRFPKPSAITSSKSAIRSTATSCRATSPRARFSTSARTKGLSVEKDRLCVYLDLTHIPRDDARPASWAAFSSIYEKFQGVDPREVPMKIFPAVHYSMGGLWVDYERTADGGLKLGSPRNQQTNIPGLYAIGECDYQYHGANRLGANSLLSCIFSGLIVAPGHRNAAQVAQRRQRGRSAGVAVRRRPASSNSRCTTTLLQRAGRRRESVSDPPGAGQGDDQGRHGRAAQRAAGRGVRQGERAGRAGQAAARSPTPATGRIRTSCSPRPCATCSRWPRRFCKGRLQRDECRGAHFKPEFAMPGFDADRPGRARREAEEWCDRFEENTRKWLKTTIAKLSPDGEPQLTYEDVDTSLIPPRPRLYGLVGADMIEEVWKERQAAKTPRSRRQWQRPTRRAPPKSQRDNNRTIDIHHVDNDHSTHAIARRSLAQRPRHAARLVRGPRAAAGCPRRSRATGSGSTCRTSGHERDQRAAADRRQGQDGRRQERRPGRLGLQLPGRSLRRLHDGHQRPRAAGLLGAGRSAAGRQSGRDRAAADDASFRSCAT